MQWIRVAAGALNQTPLDWDGNRHRIESAIQAAREQDASILCLPELCVSGYGCEDAFHAVATCETSLRVLREVLPATKDMIVSAGLPLFVRGACYNAACLLVDGRIEGFVCKQNLAGEGIHYETRWFKPWPKHFASTITVDGEEYPVGDLVFDCEGVRLGFEICEDAWVADRPGVSLARRGVDIILNPSASHFAFGKQAIRRRFVLEGSRAFSTGYVYANLLGNEAGRAIYDGGTMIAAGGQMLAEGPRFSYADCHVTAASVDIDVMRMQRAKLAVTIAGQHKETLTADRQLERAVAFCLPEEEPRPAHTHSASWEGSPDLKEEEFSRAVALALFDYMRKSRSHGFVVSLSGGADSSSVAAMVWLSILFGADDIGLDALLGKLAHIPGIAELRTPEAIVQRLLSCVYQSTRNSSDTTRHAASAVADAIGAEFMEFDVDALVEGYVGMVGQGIGRRPNWQRDDLALQNIQARVRAPSVWLLANIRGALLLATSNRSEAAVGYATMDGDTCGGLSPIAGIDKNFIRHWLCWLEKEGPRVGESRARLPSLSYVNEQQPTAELRPQESKQTDEADLMPYDVLDAIEKAAIRDKHPPIDTFRIVRPMFEQYTAEQLGQWVERFFLLWTRNQWKRERYAPSFHLDDENLDPKTWCRFPILSGGFQRELAELREFLEEA